MYFYATWQHGMHRTASPACTHLCMAGIKEWTDRMAGYIQTLLIDSHNAMMLRIADMAFSFGISASSLILSQMSVLEGWVFIWQYLILSQMSCGGGMGLHMAISGALRCPGQGMLKNDYEQWLTNNGNNITISGFSSHATREEEMRTAREPVILLMCI